MVKKEDIEMLLPWYVTGKLAPAERDRVDAYLAAHPDMDEQLKLINEDQEAVILANEALGAPAPGALERLLDGIERAPRQAFVRRNILAGFFQKFSDVFSSPAIRYAGIAAALVIMVQAVAIGTLLNQTGFPSGFETASSPVKTPVAQGTRLLISFTSTATARDITKLLKEFDATIINGPRAGGIYEIRLSEKLLTSEKVEKILVDLRKRAKLIAFATRAG